MNVWVRKLRRKAHLGSLEIPESLVEGLAQNFVLVADLVSKTVSVALQAGGNLPKPAVDRKKGTVKRKSRHKTEANKSHLARESSVVASASRS